MCDFKTKVILNNISIVLVRPRYSENIGASVRAMCNMGISKLIVVNPEDFNIDKVSKMATHTCSETVNNIVFFNNLKDALAPFGHVVGTTARLGKGRQRVTIPKTISKEVISLSQNNQVAILFGSENKGLTNDDLKYCHSLVNIPTADFSSLNLAQAVMIICYELFTVTKEIKQDSFSPRLATRLELDGMYDQLENILKLIDFTNPQNPNYWINRFHSFLSRLQLRAKEVRTLRGFLTQIVWFGENRFNSGKTENSVTAHEQEM
ncbi:MAG: hypothetical protein B6I31_03770 [Desulfobacteraceae bacterium 4572_19]|nr:MAG: hypothetical protein B6I31_03770 [Desulfobacteraceae bacterium 4572_19]